MNHTSNYAKISLSVLIFCNAFTIYPMEKSSWNPQVALSAFWMTCQNRLWGQFKTDICEIQGSRHSQQDAIVIKTINGIHFMVLGDGHGPSATKLSTNARFNKAWKANPNKTFAVFHERTRKAIGSNKKEVLTALDEGATASQYIANKVPQNIANQLPKQNGITAALMSLFKKRKTLPESEIKKLIKKALQKSDDGLFVCLNRFYKELELSDDRQDVAKDRGYEDYPGTTLALTFKYQGTLWCVNSGDSRIVVSDKKGSVIYASADHKPNSPTERARIEQAFQDRKIQGPAITEEKDINGFVRAHRIQGPAGLTVSRSFGDFHARIAGVTAEPEIKSIPFDQVDRVVIGCDGFFDCLDAHDANNSEELNSGIQKLMKANPYKKGIAQLFITEACNKPSWFNHYRDVAVPFEEIATTAHDNISVIVAQKR